MGPTVTMFDSFAAVAAGAADEWGAIVAPDDPAMDLRLLRIFQETMRDQCRCWAAIVRGERARPLAAAALCLFSVDALDTISPAARRAGSLVRRFAPAFLRFGVLFCGLPVPSGSSHIRIAPHAEPRHVLGALHAAMTALARRHRARLLAFKELDAAQAAACGQLLTSLGYLQGEIPAVYNIPCKFASFDDYLARMHPRYRHQITRSIRRFQESGLRHEFLTGDAMARAYTDELHQLYLAVWDRARYRLEKFPPEFFRVLAGEFADDASLLLIREPAESPHAGRIVGFAIGLITGRGPSPRPDGGVFHQMFVGLDHTRHSEADVYFNLYYQNLARTFDQRPRPRQLHLGQTSEEFKARIGATPEPLSLYARAVNPVLNAGLRAAGRWVFPAVPPPHRNDVFKQ